MFRQADIKIIILIMLMAIIVAVAGALTYWFILTRDPYPAGTYEIMIGDQKILVESDPNLQVQLISTPVPESAVPDETVQEGENGSTEGVAENQPAEDQNNNQVVAEGDPGTGAGNNQAISPTPVPPPIPTPIPTPIPRPPQVVIENYPVPPGETLYGITQKRNTTIALMARYGVSATDLVPGTAVQIPVANPNFCSGSFPYVVQEEDTLSSIAIKCNTSVAHLKQLNGFGENFRLDVTQVICVPNPS